MTLSENNSPNVSDNEAGQENSEQKARKRRNPFKIQKDKEEKERRQKKRARLIVRNMSYKAKEEDLRKHFEQWGKLEEVNIPKRADGKLVGCAFVQYETINQATKAILKGNGKEFLGRVIFIDWALGKDEYLAKKQQNVKEEPEEKKPKLEIKEEEEDDKKSGNVNANSENDDDDDDEGSNDDDDDDNGESEEVCCLGNSISLIIPYINNFRKILTRAMKMIPMMKMTTTMIRTVLMM